MRLGYAWAASLVLASTLVAGCMGRESDGDRTATSASWLSSGIKVPPGTGLPVRLTSTISSETAKSGDRWTGVITAPVIIGDEVVIPVGSAVHGIVEGARSARRGSQAMLELIVRSVSADGEVHAIEAATEPVVAGSPRARHMSTIAGGAAAGVLLDDAVGDAPRGRSASGVPVTSREQQVVLESGTRMTFNTIKPVRIGT